MPLSRITSREIKHCHPYKDHLYATDLYYTQLANKVMNQLSKLDIDLGDAKPSIIRYASILLANYMEDIVSDSGVWRSFSTLCREMYGYDVPMFHDEEEYYDDEPSLNVVRYLIWNAANEMDDFWWFTDQSDLLLMAQAAYDLLSDEFEKAPVNTALVEDVDKLLRDSSSDFFKMRSALVWVYSRCYITRCTAAEDALENRLDEARHVSIMEHDVNMQFYFALMTCVFIYKTGPLALYPKDYLEQLLRTRSMASIADDVAAIEAMPYGTYRYTVSPSGQTLEMERTNGRQIQVARDEIQLSDEKLFNENNAVMAQFVYYQSAWHHNGVLAPLKFKNEDEWNSMCVKDPDYMPAGIMSASADYFISRADGRQLIYFDNKKDIKSFMKKKFGFKSSMLTFLNQCKDAPVIMFFDKTEHKNVLQLSHGFINCVADADNPYYDRAIAQNDAIEMWWNEQSVGTGMLHYFLDHHMLPDVYETSFFMPSSTSGQKEQDARFLVRYMRKTKY